MTTAALEKYLPTPPADTATYDDYVAYGQIWADDRIKQWVLGDLALQLNIRYKERTLEKFADDIGVNLQTLESYRTVAKAFPLESRRIDIPWTISQVFAAQADRTELLSAREWTGREARNLLTQRAWMARTQTDRVNEWDSRYPFNDESYRSAERVLYAVVDRESVSSIHKAADTSVPRLRDYAEISVTGDAIESIEKYYGTMNAYADDVIWALVKAKLIIPGDQYMVGPKYVLGTTVRVGPFDMVLRPAPEEEEAEEEEEACEDSDHSTNVATGLTNTEVLEPTTVTTPVAADEEENTTPKPPVITSEVIRHLNADKEICDSVEGATCYGKLSLRTTINVPVTDKDFDGLLFTASLVSRSVIHAAGRKVPTAHGWHDDTVTTGVMTQADGGEIVVDITTFTVVGKTPKASNAIFMAQFPLTVEGKEKGLLGYYTGAKKWIDHTFHVVAYDERQKGDRSKVIVTAEVW